MKKKIADRWNKEEEQQQEEEKKEEEQVRVRVGPQELLAQTTILCIFIVEIARKAKTLFVTVITTNFDIKSRQACHALPE